MTGLALAALAVFVGQIVQGIAGFGSALIAVPVLVWVFGPVNAIATHALLDLAGGALLMLSPRGRVQAGIVVAVAVPLLLGQWFGTELLVRLPEDVVRVTLGVVVAGLGAGFALRAAPELGAPFEPPRGVLATGMAAGLVGGVMGGLVGPSGPPIVVWARRSFPPAEARAQLIAVFLCGAVGLVAVFAARGVLTGEILGNGAALMVPGAAGAALGARVAPRVPAQAFGRLVGTVLVGGGVSLILSGAAG